ncbi:ribonuclease pancreatic A-like [Malurus melanocephalus]|uniref:ribonuclease pancreatic A-like n=1 Tax=Malurus melanocephalus TaxID=175006 RepID=UPI00254909BA|nr:ribonuclease pancreatic A-like [Malurus melanocephalus]
MRCTQVSMAGWVLCVTLVLAALAGAQGLSSQTFEREHVDDPQTQLPARDYCNIMMARRGMTAHNCMAFNTFVHAPGETVARTCSQQPNAQGYYTTPNKMSVTICLLSSGSRWPHCKYQKAQQQQHYVEVACQDNLPVHLHNTFP